MVQSRREPKRSDSQPAMGAMIMMMTESATISNRLAKGSSPSKFCKKKGRRKLMADKVLAIKKELTSPAEPRAKHGQNQYRGLCLGLHT